MTNSSTLVKQTIDNGRYEIRSVLGKGGIGTVYLAPLLYYGESHIIRAIHMMPKTDLRGILHMPVEMKLSRIIISDINDHQVIYLKEVDGERTFPIVIGIAEASSIDRRVKNFETSRPLTHDLICLVVDTLGAEFDSVLISDVEGHTFYARLRIRKDGEILEVDSRPSDAIAVAVSCDPPLSIYVEEKVLEDAIAEA